MKALITILALCLSLSAVAQPPRVSTTITIADWGTAIAPLRAEWRKNSSDSAERVRRQFSDSLRRLETRFTRSLNDSLKTLATVAVGIIPAGLIDGKNRVFNLPDRIVLGSEVLYLNGLRLRPVVDYVATIVSGKGRITFTTAPPAGAWLVVDYLR